MKLQIRVNKDGVIEESVFKTFGCGSAIASSSLATEWVKNKNVNEAGSFSFVSFRSVVVVQTTFSSSFLLVTIKNSDIAKELCLPPIKLHCSMLAEGLSALSPRTRK